jgi:hypothetical protein
MGMAHLMGQLGLPQSFEKAIPLLNRAATIATIDVPQPAYVYGLLLLSEFTQITVPPTYFHPFIAPGSSIPTEVCKHVERAATTRRKVSSDGKLLQIKPKVQTQSYFQNSRRFPTPRKPQNSRLC